MFHGYLQHDYLLLDQFRLGMQGLLHEGLEAVEASVSHEPGDDVVELRIQVFGQGHQEKHEFIVGVEGQDESGA